MRILHVVHSAAFYGVERYVSTLARAQAAMGDLVTVVGGEPASMRKALGGVAHWDQGGSIARMCESVMRWRGADVIHAHMTDAESASVALRALIDRRACVVATRHFAKRRGASRAGSLIAPFIGRELDGQIAISRYVADRIEGESTVIYPGVPGPTADQVERQPVVLVAQRLEAEKATDVALAGFVASGLVARGWRLRIAGDGALRTELQRQAEHFRVSDSVDFLGRRDDIPQLMASSSLLLASTPIEAFGLAVAEAMAAGLPVVATLAGGHLESLPAAELDHGFEPGDAKAAGTALRTVALDPDLWSRLAMLGKERHRSALTPQIQAERTRTFYTEVMEARQ